MAQIRQDFVNVTNGAAYVDSTNALTDWSTVAPGHLFTVEGDGSLYTIASVLLPGPAGVPRITLTAPYGGVTATAVAYAITTDFTPNLNLPLINRGDIETGELYSDAMTKIDEIQAGAGVTKTYVDEADANLQNQIDANEDAIVDLIPNKIALGDIQVPDNAIQNAGMWYWQRGLNVDRVINGANLGIFGPDRFKLTADGTWNLKIRNLDDQDLTFSGYPRSNRVARITAVGTHSTLLAADRVYVRYGMEGLDFARIDGLPWTYTMWVRTNRTGTMYMSVRAIVYNYDATNEYFMQDFLINPNGTTALQLSFPARTSILARKSNELALLIDCAFAAGTSHHSPASTVWNTGVGTATTARQTNFFDAAGNYVDVWGPCLRTGSIAVPQRVSVDGANDLTKIQRYYAKSYQIDVNPGTSGWSGSEEMYTNAATAIRGRARFPVVMRTTPTIAIYNPSDGTLNNAYDSMANLIRPVTGLTYTSEVGFNGVNITGGVVGNHLLFHYTAEADF
jgi:hypothetical protein